MCGLSKLESFNSLRILYVPLIAMKTFLIFLVHGGNSGIKTNRITGPKGERKKKKEKKAIS